MSSVRSAPDRNSRPKLSTNCSKRSAQPSMNSPAGCCRNHGGNTMEKTTWGRKETIIWPQHMPIYTYGLTFAVVVLTFVAVCIRTRFATPLQRYYLPVYERTSAFGAISPTHRSSYRMLFVSKLGVAPRPAMNGDVGLGRTPEPDGRSIPLSLSADARQQEYSLLFCGPQHTYVDTRLRDYLKDV